MSLNEILCQISTFLAAGHETSSSSLTWTLYALARAPHVQTKLRTALHALAVPPSSSHSHSHSHSSSPPTDADLQRILAHPYLDAVVREGLRLHAPATSTMRVAGGRADDGSVVPLSTGFVRLRAGDIVTIPLQAMNRSRAVWGEDAEAFVPERWMGSGDGGGGVMYNSRTQRRRQ